MSFFRNLSIRLKMNVAVLGTTTIALVLACAAFVAYERLNSRRAMDRNLTVLADALADNSAAALSFAGLQDTAEDAAHILAALDAAPEVTAACLYTDEGTPNGSYTRRGSEASFPASPEQDGTRIVGNSMLVVRPVKNAGKRVGTIYLRADLTEMNARLKVYAGVSALVLLGSFLLALTLAAALQRLVLRPILALTETAKRIAETRDYAARAEKVSADEIGTLTDGFNQMLAGIQERDNALRTANAALRESEDRLNFALRQSRTGGWNLDLADHTVYRSLEYDRIFGYERLLPQWTYEMFLEHVVLEDRAGTDQSFRAAIEGHTDWSRECRIRRTDGEVRWIWASGEHQRDPAGEMRHMAGIVQDITERKQAEERIRQLNATLEERVRERTAELETAVRELDAFSYSVSHDLRAPLRAVDGYSRMLLEDYGPNLDDDGRRKVGVIRGETQRMGQLIDDLLAFSRLSRQKTEAEEIDMQALAQKVYDELAALEPTRQFQLQLPPLPVALGTRAMIRQVWVNLIGNAIKFTKGRAVAEIEIGTAKMNGGGTTYYVRDNGAGFDMRHVGKLFGVFQRLHGQEEFRGTGVGLALVQRIVQRHGGRIWAEGEVERGATFYFTIPN